MATVSGLHMGEPEGLEEKLTAPRDCQTGTLDRPQVDMLGVDVARDT